MNIPSRFWKSLLAGLLCILALASSTILRGQDLSITARLDRGEMAIGEQALLTLKIRTEDLDHTLLLIPPDSAIHRAEALSFVVTDTVAIDDKIKEITAEMVITSFDSTIVVIPAFGAKLGAKEVFADPLYLKVTLPQVDLSQPEKFYPIKESWTLPYTFWEVVRILLPWIGGVALAVGLWFLFRYLRRRLRQRPKMPTPRKEKTLSPYQALCQTVDDISLSLDDRTFYTLLDLAFREFLAQSILPNAMEMSTTQLTLSLQQSTLSSLSKEGKPMATLLERTSLAKFAKVAYSIQQKEDDRKQILLTAKGITNELEQPNLNASREELKS